MSRFHIFPLLACCITALSFNCNESPTTAPDGPRVLTPQTGQFGLSWLQGLAKNGGTADTGKIKTEPYIMFDLGEIKGSTSFYFLLYNVGSKAITGLSLQTDNPDFAVYPSSIDTLMPNGNVGMLPVVKVSALHGTAPEGVGYRDLMPMGANIATLTVRGKTKTFKGIDTTVILTTALKLHALVMDADFRLGNDLVDLSRPPMTGGYCGIGYGNSKDTVLSIINTGNVLITATAHFISAGDGHIFDTLTLKIPVSEKVSFSITGWTGHYVETEGLYTRVFLKGENAVMPPSLPVYPDAMGCILFFDPRFGR